MSMYGPINSGAAAGGNGAATSNKTSSTVISGFIAAIHVKYNDAPPATTDVVIATAGNTGPAMTLLTLTNKNTSGWFYPRITAQTALGVDSASNTDSQFPVICDNLKVTIDGADAADNVDVYLLLVDA